MMSLFGVSGGTRTLDSLVVETLNGESCSTMISDPVGDCFSEEERGSSSEKTDPRSVSSMSWSSSLT